MNKPKKLFVERLDNMKYAVKEPKAKKPLAIASTQEKAIEKAKALKPVQLLVERVRDTVKGGRDKWRKPN